MKDLTICVPVYKRFDYLKDLVENIPEDYPICISDNGNYLPDDFFSRGNIKIKHLESVVPMFSNWNETIKMVETNWFTIPGDDDIIYPDKLDIIWDKINNFSDCAVLAFGYDIINEREEKRKGWLPVITRRYDKIDAFYHIQRTIPYRCPALVINTEKSQSIGNYDQNFEFTASDSLYLQHLAMLYPIVEINEIVAGYRVWDNSFTNVKIATKEWFDQLNLWINKTSKLLVDNKIEGCDINRLHDNIIVDNLMVAFKVASNLNTKFKLLKSVGWPRKIGLKNHLRLIKYLFL